MNLPPSWNHQNVSDGAWVVVLVLGAASAFGVFRLLTDGRFRGTHRVRGAEPSQGPSQEPSQEQEQGFADPPWVLHDIDLEHELGQKATLVQFSSAFCAPCRATRRILSDVAAAVPGVTHVEIDAEHHLELVRRVGVLRTPTTLVLDAAGHEVTRASGTPRKETVLAALAQAVPE